MRMLIQLLRDFFLGDNSETLSTQSLSQSQARNLQKGNLYRLQQMKKQQDFLNEQRKEQCYDPTYPLDHLRITARAIRNSNIEVVNRQALNQQYIAYVPPELDYETIFDYAGTLRPLNYDDYVPARKKARNTAIWTTRLVDHRQEVDFLSTRQNQQGSKFLPKCAQDSTSEFPLIEVDHSHRIRRICGPVANDTSTAEGENLSQD